MSVIPASSSVAREGIWFTSYEAWRRDQRALRKQFLRQVLRDLWPLLALMVVLGGLSLAVDWLGFTVPLIGLLVSCVLVSDYRTTEARYFKALSERIQEDTSGLQDWYVWVRIHDGDRVTGSDYGVLWFDDSQLYFYGNCTSFSLTRDDLGESAGLFLHSFQRLKGVHFERVLQLRDSRVLSIEYGPGCRRFSGRDHLELSSALNRFLNLNPVGHGGQLPPRTIGPGALSSTGYLVLARRVFLIPVGVFVGVAWGVSRLPVFLDSGGTPWSVALVVGVAGAVLAFRCLHGPRWVRGIYATRLGWK